MAVNRKWLKALLFYTALFLLLFLVECCFAPYLAVRFSFLTLNGRFPQLPIRPDLMLCMTLVAGILFEPRPAAVLGLVFGFLSDVTVGNPYLFSPAVFAVCGFLVRYPMRIFTRKNALTAALASIPFLAIRALTTAFFLIATNGGTPILDLVVGGVLPEFLCHVVAVVITFLLADLLRRPFGVERTRTPS